MKINRVNEFLEAVKEDAAEERRGRRILRDEENVKKFGKRRLVKKDTEEKTSGGRE